MTISGGVPAATAVGYFWKNVSHGMPSEWRQTSGLSWTNFSSNWANTAPSVPVRPCHRINGSLHSPKAFTIGVGSRVGPPAGASVACAASVAAASVGALSGAVVPAGAPPPQALSTSDMIISRVRLNNTLLAFLTLFILLSFCEIKKTEHDRPLKTQVIFCVTTKLTYDGEISVFQSCQGTSVRQ